MNLLGKSVRLVAIFVSLAAASIPVLAQSTGSPPSPGSANAAGLGNEEPPPPPEPAGGTGEVTLRIVQFGAMNAARPGDWIGMQIELSYSGDKQRNVLVRVNNPDADGDTALPGRTIVCEPGKKKTVWLYGWLPFEAGNGSTFTITAHEAEERSEGASADGGGDFAPGRLLGITRYPFNTIPATNSQIAVVGRAMAGLQQYELSFGGALSTADYAITGHEITHFAKDLTSENLPDRWLGLCPFESIVWTGATSAEDPSKLTSDQAGAIREWVKRGGHLVILMPMAGQNWIGATANPLTDILPAVRANRVEGVDLDIYRHLLARRREAVLPKNAALYHFTPEPSAGVYDAMPILKGSDGTVVVTRRLVGTGAVTLIGLNLAQPELNNVTGALEADVFWHRVLGKRLPLIPAAELDKMRTGADGRPPAYTAGRLNIHLFDELIPSITSRSAQAAVGVLLAFVVFLAYWLLAAPVAHLVLKQKNKREYSWLIFLAAAGVFTGIAWGGASLLKLGRVEGMHFTLVDHIYGQSNQRARSWINLVLPSYGDERISIRTPIDETAGWHQALTAWAPPPAPGGSVWSAFPDARGYAVAAQSPDTLTVPTRATVKRFQADWAGSLSAAWSMPRPLAPADASSIQLGSEIKIIDPPDGAATQSGKRRWKLYGTLTHRLPGALTDVTVILVQRQAFFNAPQGSLLSTTLAASLVDRWEPGTALDLDKVIPESISDQIEQRLRGLIPRGFTDSALTNATPTSSSITNDILGISLYSLIPGPDRNERDWARVHRQATHGYDLARWFTQPCLIIIGQVEKSECPVPISVGGLLPEDLCPRIKGTTVVRWVYPLPPSPPEARGAAGPAPDAEPDPLDALPTRGSGGE